MDRSKWEYKKLGEVCEKGSSNIAQNKIEDNTGDYALYGASGYVKSIDFYHQEQPYIGVVKDGSGVGRVNKYPAKSSLLGTMQYIYPKNGCDLGYLLYVLQGLHLEKYKTGAAIPHIYFKDYCKCEVPFPSLLDQQRIVAELDCLNEMIALKQEQLKEFDKLAQSIFYDMFGDPVENEKGWKTYKLGELGLLARGVSKHRPRNAPELLGGTMPLIQTGDVANAEMFITAYNSTYSDLGVAQSKVWKAGTLCITIAATIGKCAILAFDACFPDSVVGFMAESSKTNNEYMYFIFKRLQKILEMNAPAVAQKNINLAVLNALQIPLPPLALQQQFAEKISAIEAQKELVKQSIAETQQLLDSRMDYYFD